MMRALKNILLNLGILALLFAVMIPAGNAEGQLGQCSIHAIAFFLSITMAIVSGLAYGMAGRRSSLAMRCLSLVAVIWLFLTVGLFIHFEKPELLKDAAQYWVGAIMSVSLVVLQGFCNRANFRLLLLGPKP
jgi:heme/copper-type cytochrome/quinol oxidase subunit 4